MKQRKTKVSYTIKTETIYILKALVSRGEASSMSELIDNIVGFFGMTYGEYNGFPFDQLVNLGKRLHEGNEAEIISTIKLEGQLAAVRKGFNKKDQDSDEIEIGKFNPENFRNPGDKW